MKKQEKKREEKEATAAEDSPVTPNAEVVEKGKKIKEDLDKVMDEIDDVLEENAEEFIKNYVQKGGQ